MVDEVTKIAYKRRLMEEAGLSESEAERIAEETFREEKKPDPSQETFGKIAQAGEVLSNLPPEAKDAFLPALQAAMMTSNTKKSDDWMEDMKKMIMQLEMTKALLGKKDSEESKVTDKLIDMLKEWRDKAIEADIMKKDEELKTIQEQYAQMHGAIVEALQKITEKITNNQPQEEEDLTTRVTKDFQKLQELKKLLVELGMVREGSNDVDRQKLIEQLKKEGYRIEGPPDWETMQRMIENEVQKREKEIRKQVEEELGVKKEKTRMFMDFFLALMDGVMSVASTSGGKKALGDFASMLKNAVSGDKGGSEEGGSEQTGD